VMEAGDGGDEKLVVGCDRNRKSQILEYSLTR